MTSSVDSFERFEWRMNFTASWITSRRRYSASDANARATSSGRDSTPTDVAMDATEEGGTRSRSSPEDMAAGGGSGKRR